MTEFILNGIISHNIFLHCYEKGEKQWLTIYRDFLMQYPTMGKNNGSQHLEQAKKMELHKSLILLFQFGFQILMTTFFALSVVQCVDVN